MKRFTDYMVRPRFAKLPPDQQQVILGAALAEFAAHGFHNASLNRVIDAAGISKGSMYYYFDGKEDLFAYVMQTKSVELFERAGPLPKLDEGDADDYWTAVEDYYLRLALELTAAPQLAAMFRGWAAASRSPAFQQTQSELEQATVPWVERALASGQGVGAVRDDLPPSLLVAIAMGMGEAMDLWLMSQPVAPDELPRWIRGFVEMMRGALAPKSATFQDRD